MNKKRGKPKIFTSLSVLSQRRGLSPVIATVLLVGIVVVMELIIFAWFRGLTQEAVIKFDQNVQLVCDDVEFQASFSGSALSVSNIGNIPLFGLKAKIATGGSFTTSDIKELSEDWPVSGLGQGQAASIDIGSQTADTITLTPILMGTSQSGVQKSFTCDESRHGRSISI